MPDSIQLVPATTSLKQVHGTLLVARGQDGTLIRVSVDDSGQLQTAAGVGNDYSLMSDVIQLVPVTNPLKQVHGALLVGRTADGVLLPVACDDEGRLLIGGSGGGSSFIIWRTAPAYPGVEAAPPNPAIAGDLHFEDGSPTLTWHPSVANIDVALLNWH